MTDDNLGAASRALLDAARPAMAPDGEAARRMRAKIAASVGGAAAIGGGAAKPAIAAKLGGSLLVVGVIIVGAILFASRREPERAVTRVTAPVGERAPIVPPTVTPIAPAVAQVVPATIEQDMPEVAIGRAKPRRVTAVGPDTGQGTVEVIKPVKSTTTLAREVELIDRAMASLRKGDARAALAAIRDYDTETTGTGQLAEDAAAIQVEALCAIKDPSAVTRLATFDERYPRSAQRSRLNDACTR